MKNADAIDTTKRKGLAAQTEDPNQKNCLVGTIKSKIWKKD